MAVDMELRHLQEQQSERVRGRVPHPPVTSEFLDAMSQTELKDVILDLFDQVRQANAKVVEMAAALEEKDRRNASLAEKLDAVLENQRQQKLDLESWLAKERQWNKERESFQKTIRDLNDLVKVLKKAKFVGTSQKSAKKTGKDKGDDGDGNAEATATSTEEPDLAENKEGFDGKDEDARCSGSSSETIT